MYPVKSPLVAYASVDKIKDSMGNEKKIIRSICACTYILLTPSAIDRNYKTDRTYTHITTLYIILLHKHK